MKVTEQILFEFAKLEHRFGDRRIRLTMSAGVAGFPDDAGSVEGLLSQAETALGRAKALGHNRLALPDVEPKARSARALETADEPSGDPSDDTTVDEGDATSKNLSAIRADRDKGTVSSAAEDDDTSP
jgi:predicted signal transduction protein with EAL and GGDEF domain